MKSCNILSKSIIEKILLRRRKIDESTGCWLYTWGLNHTGYAYITICGRSFAVHRLSLWIYQDFNLKNDQKVLHKQECSVKSCFNPEHLYVGTQKQNVWDSIERGNHYIFGELM